MDCFTVCDILNKRGYYLLFASCDTGRSLLIIGAKKGKSKSVQAKCISYFI